MKRHLSIYFCGFCIYMFSLIAQAVDGELPTNQERMSLRQLHELINKEPSSAIQAEENLLRYAHDKNVSVEHLVRAYPSELITSTFKKYLSSISHLCESTPDDLLESACVVFKLGIAYGSQNGFDKPELAGIITIVMSQADPQYDTLNMLRIRSLNPDRSSVYFAVMQQLNFKLNELVHASEPRQQS